MTTEAGACPNCGGKEVQPAGVLRKHVNPLSFYLFGWIFTLLWSGTRKEQVRCVGCDTLFERPTRASKIALVLLVVFILLLLLGLLATFFGPAQEH